MPVSGLKEAKPRRNSFSDWRSATQLSPSEKLLHAQLHRMREDKPWALARGTVPIEKGPNSFTMGGCVVELSFWEKYHLMELSSPIFELPTDNAESRANLIASVRAKVAELDKEIQDNSNQELVLAIRDCSRVLLLRQTPMSMLEEESLFRFRREVDVFCRVAKKAKADMAIALDPSNTERPREQMLRRNSLRRSLSKISFSRRSLIQKSDSSAALFGSFRRHKKTPAPPAA